MCEVEHKNEEDSENVEMTDDESAEANEEIEEIEDNLNIEAKVEAVEILCEAIEALEEEQKEDGALSGSNLG